jgi:hypothetical protein
VVHDRCPIDVVLRHVQLVMVTLELDSWVDCGILGECIHLLPTAFIGRCMVRAVIPPERIAPDK